MRVVHHPSELSRACDEARRHGKTVGLVPTMGALHAGHASLVAAAARQTHVPVVTIFVNPTQFGPHEDLARYPRTLDADCALAESHGAAIVFAPAAETIYPPSDETRVRVGATASALCGAHRPGHFEGVATVVAKLFGIVGRSTAWFGRKDYQQLRVIERMTADLFLPVEIVHHPTVREDDGLALSSRNRYLDAAAREKARAIPKGLSRAVHAFGLGERRVDELERICREPIAAAFDAIDYVTVADPDRVLPLGAGQRAGDRVLLAVAARIGGARLIDNVVLGDDPAPVQGALA